MEWHQAAQEGNMDVINKYLDDEEFDIDARNAEGQTALHVAVQYGQCTVGSLLCESGAAVEAKDVHGNTPLHTAAIHNQRLAASFLFWGGSDATIANAKGNTALHEAAASGAKDCVYLILDRQADECKELKNHNGQTALDIATQMAAETKKPVYDKVVLTLQTGSHVD